MIVVYRNQALKDAILSRKDNQIMIIYGVGHREDIAKKLIAYQEIANE